MVKNSMSGLEYIKSKQTGHLFVNYFFKFRNTLEKLLASHCAPIRNWYSRSYYVPKKNY